MTNNKLSLTEIMKTAGKDFIKDCATKNGFCTGLLLVPTHLNAYALAGRVKKNIDENILTWKLSVSTTTLGTILGMAATIYEGAYILQQAIEKNNYAPLIALGAAQAGALAYHYVDKAKRELKGEYKNSE